jgi:hypothetical protein
MQLARQAADVARVGEESRDQPFFRRDRLPVLAGRAWCAGSARSGSWPATGVQSGFWQKARSNSTPPSASASIRGVRTQRVAVAAQGVEPLLVGADPEDIGSVHRFRAFHRGSATRRPHHTAPRAARPPETMSPHPRGDGPPPRDPPRPPDPPDRLRRLHPPLRRGHFFDIDRTSQDHIRPPERARRGAGPSDRSAGRSPASGRDRRACRPVPAGSRAGNVSWGRGLGPGRGPGRRGLDA